MHDQNGGGGGGMGTRGVTRPMPLKKAREHAEQLGSDGMSAERRHHMMVMHHKQTLWVWWTLVMLGVWMVVSPLTFGWSNVVAEPAGGRELWISDAARVSVARWSDIISGVLLIVLGWLSLKPGRALAKWAACFVGIWLTLAPVLFWAPSAAVYLNDTLVGALVIALTILIPGMPKMVMYMKMGGDLPKGWTYNPSSWPQRWVMIVLAFAGWLVSRYLAAYQLGFIDSVWDPFFPGGSQKVLTSKMSESLPVSDAALGSLAYTFELLMGFMGSPKRWRTMPWMVALFGILVIPLGLVHILLVVSQPVIVGAWCTLCLVAAAIMLPMLPLEGDEVIAMLQHVRRATRRGASLWSVFWKGGEPEGATMDERTPPLVNLADQPVPVLRSGFWGMSIPWNQAATAIAGLWVTFSPVVWKVGSPGSAFLHAAGLLVIVVSVISMGEVFRLFRFANVVLGLAVAIVPWLIGAEAYAAQVNASVVGALIVALAVPRGPIREQYGSWNRLVW